MVSCGVVTSSRSKRPRRLGRSFVVSFLLHAAAIVAAAQTSLRLARWELRLPQGRNSIALSASIASPQTESETTLRIEPPRLETAEKVLKRRPADAPVLAATPFASAHVDRRSPPPAEVMRVAADESPEPPAPREQSPPKRTAEARLQQHDATTSVESVASAPAAASSGAQASTPPTEIVSVKPIYPPAALAAGLEGIVKLYVRVNEQGQVVEADIYQSSGHETLDRAALEVIYRWRFTSPDGTRGIATEFIKPIPFRIVR